MYVNKKEEIKKRKGLKWWEIENEDGRRKEDKWGNE